MWTHLAADTASTEPTNIWGFLASAVAAVLALLTASRKVVSRHRAPSDERADRNPAPLVREAVTRTEQAVEDNLTVYLRQQVVQLQQALSVAQSTANEAQTTLATIMSDLATCRVEKHNALNQVLILQGQLMQSQVRPRPGAEDV